MTVGSWAVESASSENSLSIVHDKLQQRIKTVIIKCITPHASRTKNPAARAGTWKVRRTVRVKSKVNQHSQISHQRFSHVQRGHTPFPPVHCQDDRPASLRCSTSYFGMSDVDSLTPSTAINHKRTVVSDLYFAAICHLFNAARHMLFYDSDVQFPSPRSGTTRKIILEVGS